MNSLFGWGGGGVPRRDPLLEDDGLYDEEGVGSGRPPPFNPSSQRGGGAYDEPAPYRETFGDYNRQQAPARLSPRPEARASPRANPRQQQQVVYPGEGPQTIYVDHGGQQQPAVVILRDERGVRGPVAEGVCCALMIFILGFTFPLLWLTACCQLSSPSRSVRFLSRCSILCLVLVATGLGAIIINDAKTGKWPWDKECFFPWDPKCKYPPKTP